MTPTTPAIFLDRDGTLVRDVRHSADPARLEILAGVVDALVALRHAGFRLVVVTNQSGVARGRFTRAEAEAMGRALRHALFEQGVAISGYYFCPHYPDGEDERYAFACRCRKPQPGLIYAAAEAHNIDLAASWMIGDSASDVQAAGAAGVRPLLVDIGRPDLDGPLSDRVPVARNLAHAAAIILTGAPPMPASSFAGRLPQADRRVVGEASPWPDESWAEQARRDAEALRAG